MNNNKKSLILPLIITIVVALAFYAVLNIRLDKNLKYFSSKSDIVNGISSTNSASSTINTGEKPIVCKTDLKQCMDGSYIQRAGPQCEFFCPLLYTNTKYGFKLFYNSGWIYQENENDPAGNFVSFGPNVLYSEGAGAKIYLWKDIPGEGPIRTIDDLKKAIGNIRKEDGIKITVEKIGGFDVVMTGDLPGYYGIEPEAFVLLDNNLGILSIFPGDFVKSIQKI